MTRALRVSVADDEADMREFFDVILKGSGHEVVSMAENGSQLIAHCRDLDPDLVITDIKMSDMDGLEAARRIYAERPVPIIVISAYHDEEFLQRARAARVMAYLVKPVRESDLAPAITVAMSRFEEFEALREETRDIRQALEDRKTIEKAKGILMKQLGLDEHQAFRKLQKLATTKRMKLSDVATTILVASELFDADDET